jgi:hypothetical protein
LVEATAFAIEAKSLFAIFAFEKIQLPPTANTFFSLRKSSAFEEVIPPVGRKRRFGKGAEKERKPETPPKVIAGNHFISVTPILSAESISVGVATPGR